MILLLVNTRGFSQLKNAVTVSRKEVKMFRSRQFTVIFFFLSGCMLVRMSRSQAGVFLTALLFQFRSRALLRNLQMTCLVPVISNIHFFQISINHKGK